MNRATISAGAGRSSSPTLPRMPSTTRAIDLVRVVHVGVDVVGDPFAGAGEQHTCVDQLQGVVVHVNDFGLGCDALGYFVGVVGRGQAGAEVEELADADLAARKRTARPRNAGDATATSTTSG